MSTICLVTGGVKSGKSSYALNLALRYEAPRLFIATATAFDEEMRIRIENHKKERKGQFDTIEEPIEISKVLKRTTNYSVSVLDCVTLWINNLLYHNKIQEIDKFIETLKDIDCDLIIVSNEVGMGIMPDNKLARQYADLLGKTNQRIAELADKVILMVSGIAVNIKGE